VNRTTREEKLAWDDAGERRAPGFVVMPRDVEVLAWTARHGMVTSEQVCSRFFSSLRATWRRLGRLESARLIRRDRALISWRHIVRTSRAGISLADVDLGLAPLDYVRMAHNLAVVDLSEELLAAHPGSRWLTERELRRDRMRAARRDPSVLRGRIPDGLLVLGEGIRVAVELDRTAKRTRRLEKLVASYAWQGEVDRVWWYMPSNAAVERVTDVIRAHGMEHAIEARLRRVDVRR